MFHCEVFSNLFSSQLLATFSPVRALPSLASLHKKLHCFWIIVKDKKGRSMDRSPLPLTYRRRHNNIKITGPLKGDQTNHSEHRGLIPSWYIILLLCSSLPILHVSGKQNSQDCSPLNTSVSYSLVLFSLLLVQITGTNRKKILWMTATNTESLGWLLGTPHQQA